MAREKKVKVVYDVDGKNKKFAKKAKRDDRDSSFGKVNAMITIAIIIVNALWYYFATPSINIQNPGFFIWLIFIFLMLIFGSANFKTARKTDKFTMGDAFAVPSYSKILLAGIGISVAVMIVGAIASSKLFNAGRYAGLIDITESDFTEVIAESEDISDIALMDTDSARIIGDRAIGSLSDVVSQYQVSEDYTTIDLNGKPMKVASLEYAGFIKYLNNRKSGIPGYVLVDPVNNEAKYVKLDKAIRYSTSACFNENLQRHVQLSYPTYIFEGYYLELDDDGNPYYTCPVLKAHAGLFGAKDVKGAVICDPCTGDTTYYDVADVPNWVDRVYDGDLATQKYDWYGTLSGGYINSIIGNKGCKRTTDDYGYKVMDGDVWMYTGVTSVNGDQSNIGFVLSNLRTAETKYFSIAGAEEHSAMDSAEGQVQNLGYEASFPSLINIAGVPTYIMVLKDNAGLVKMYALVNVEKYNIVATGNTQKEALTSYKKLLVENKVELNSSTSEEDSGMKTADIVVADIEYITMDGETYAYITANDGSVYKQAFAENESLIFIQPKDKITVSFYESEDGINELESYK